MGTLNAALAWAARGFAVFPLRENTREPAHGTDWNNIATTDPLAIRALWVDPVLQTERDYNVGCACTDMVVVDIDVKKGKQGYAEYISMGGEWDTLVVATPSGGYHCYFSGPDSSNAPLSNGVDVRSHRGYVVAPGSSIDGVPYRVINDVDMAWVPLAIEQRLKAPDIRREVDTSVVEYDTPAAIDAATRFLQSTPPAIEGMRGDETTFITAARLVREMALSPETAYLLLLEHWNPRCEPPWGGEQLWEKVQNAYAYGTADAGRLSPETLFGHLTIDAPPSAFAQVSDWGNAILATSMVKRPWLYDRMLMRGAVTVLLAAGSAGKSSLSLAIAAHAALGLPFAGNNIKEPCSTIVYNGEDDLQEQSRRLWAICAVYSFDYELVKSRILLLSSREMKLHLVTKEGNRPVRNDIIIKQLIEKASATDVGLLIVDPLVKIHQCNESDNVEMDVVMEVLTDIGHHANIAVLALHHTSKSNGRHEDRVGNMDNSRGASAIVNAARIAFTLLSASQQDAEDYGMEDSERHMWVRLDDAKMNLALAGENATWFRKEGQRIPTMDVVGVLKHQTLTKDRMHIRQRIAKHIVASMEANGQGSVTMAQSIAIIKVNEPLWANKTDTDIRRRLEGFMDQPVTVDGRTLRSQRDANNDGKVIFTLT